MQERVNDGGFKTKSIRSIAEAHDHFLVERDVRVLAWFAIAVLDALDEVYGDGRDHGSRLVEGQILAVEDIRVAIARAGQGLWQDEP
jgi:hypothetical protein